MHASTASSEPNGRFVLGDGGRFGTAGRIGGLDDTYDRGLEPRQTSLVKPGPRKRCVASRSAVRRRTRSLFVSWAARDRRLTEDDAGRRAREPRRRETTARAHEPVSLRRAVDRKSERVRVTRARNDVPRAEFGPELRDFRLRESFGRGRTGRFAHCLRLYAKGEGEPSRFVRSDGGGGSGVGLARGRSGERSRRRRPAPVATAVSRARFSGIREE